MSPIAPARPLSSCQITCNESCTDPHTVSLPMQTSLKMLYWSMLMYDYEEVRLRLTLQTANPAVAWFIAWSEKCWYLPPVCESSRSVCKPC